MVSRRNLVPDDLAERFALEIGAVDLGVGIEQQFLQERAWRGREVAIHQADIAVLLDLACEQRREFLVVHHAAPGLVDQIIGNIEFGLDDDAEQAVAADHEIEQVLVLGRRHRLHRAIRQHHLHRLDRFGERAGLMVHAVGVDRDRAADAEDVGRLHGANRKARMQHVLDVVPGRARLHGDRSRALVEHDLVEAAHVEHDAALAEGVPAHAVTHAGGRHRELVVARKGQRLRDILDAAHLDHAVDFGLVEAARIIDAAAKLRPFHVLERRNRLDPLQIDLRLLAAADRRPAILFPGGIGRQRLKLAIAVNA